LDLFRNDSTAIVLVVANLVPVKLALDVFGRFAEHGILSEDEQMPSPSLQKPRGLAKL
jgi:hypothetical protein